ncbi:MAG: response regulator transcription factor [Thermoleophilia bacterium]
MSSVPILLVENEENIASFVAMYLKKEGFQVSVAVTGEAGLALAAQSPPGVVILDIMLPDIDGFEVCRRLRRVSDVPVIMLTARDNLTDKVVGLELGADDYVTKPFDPRELVARVKSVLRRSTPADAASPGGCLNSGELSLDSERHEVTVSGEQVRLTAKEFDLISYLMLNHGLALSRQQLLAHVWGYEFYGDTRTVDVHINQLRKKLGSAVRIETVRSVGYKLVS